MLPAIQQLLASCSLASGSRPAAAEGDAATETLLGDPASVQAAAAGAVPSPSSSTFQHQTPRRALAFSHPAGPQQQHFSPFSSISVEVATTTSSGSSRQPGGGRSGTDDKQSSSKSRSSSSGAGGQLADPLSQALQRLHASPTAHNLTPSAIVQQLDKYIVGQPVSVLPGYTDSQPAGQPWHVMGQLVHACSTTVWLSTENCLCGVCGAVAGCKACRRSRAAQPLAPPQAP